LVTLTAVLDDGKTALQPGETVSMEEGQAKKLAALGMVKLPKAAKAKNGKSSGKKALSPPDEAGEQDDAPGGDADDGGEAGIGETRDL
jgi:hypothetical protein